MNRINLDTCFPIKAEGPPYALPVLVDLNWHGAVLTSDNGGIVPSRSASFDLSSILADDSVIL